MKISSLGIKISLLIVIIVSSVIATGYLAYKNLSQIVYTIHDVARPDYKLIKIKEIASDLQDADNSVRLYALTHEPHYLKPYNKIIYTVDSRIQELYSLEKDTVQYRMIHALEELIGERLVIWDELLVLHSKPVEKAVFDDFYQKLEKNTNDSTNLKKENILKRFFKHKKEEVKLGTAEVHQEIEKLEKRLSDSVSILANRELDLLQHNSTLGTKIQFIILQLEQKESESILISGLEADQQADRTYHWLAVFCMIAVLLLLVVLFIILNYSRKSSRTQLYLQKAKEEAESLAKVKEQFTANVSHELRTPMNAIFGLSEQLLSHPMDQEMKNQLVVINKSASHLSRVVNDILDFSKLEAGKLEIETIEFDLRELIQSIFTLNVAEAEKRQIEFECKVDPDFPVSISGDPTRLFQILNNLLGNAFKFTTAGKIALSVKQGQILEEGVEMILEVSDTGIGIEKEKMDQIFEDYVQADLSTSRNFGGTGLGLSIVRKLAHLMGGTIHVKSEVGKGSLFICILPVKPVITASQADFKSSDYSQFSEKIKNITCLVADDEEYNRMVLAMVLKKWEIDFDLVTNGWEAIELAGKKHFDLVLMDIRMPGIGGFEASEKIMKQNPDTRIILLTAAIGKEEYDKSRKMGIDGLILKPFSEKHLIDTMNQALPVPGLLNLSKEQIRLNNELLTERSKSDESFTIHSDVTLNEEPLKLNDLLRDAGGDQKFVEEMLRLFIKTSTEGMQAMKLSLMEETFQILSDTAHKMAAPCRHLGAKALYQFIKNVEKSATLGDKAYLSQQILNIEQELQIIIPWINEKLNAIQEQIS